MILLPWMRVRHPPFTLHASISESETKRSPPCALYKESGSRVWVKKIVLH